MYVIPFNSETYVPKSIPSNDTADTPVTFTLSQVGGPDLVRLKGLIYGTSVLAHAHTWHKDVAAAALDAFKESPSFFVRGIDKIAGLSVPYALAKKADIVPASVDESNPPATIAVTNGTQFAAVSPYVVALAFEIAMQLAKVSGSSEIDPRFFGSGSGSPRKNATPSGSATPARKPRKPRGTAASATPTVN